MVIELIPSSSVLEGFDIVSCIEMNVYSFSVSGKTVNIRYYVLWDNGLTLSLSFLIPLRLQVSETKK